MIIKLLLFVFIAVFFWVILPNSSRKCKSTRIGEIDWLHPIQHMIHTHENKNTHFFPAVNKLILVVGSIKKTLTNVPKKVFQFLRREKIVRKMNK